MDIGTTTLALYLYDLEKGRLLATGSERNPQAVFGADVISRLEKALAGEGEALAASIRGGIARLLGESCAPVRMGAARNRSASLAKGAHPTSLTSR